MAETDVCGTIWKDANANYESEISLRIDSENQWVEDTEAEYLSNKKQARGLGDEAFVTSTGESSKDELISKVSNGTVSLCECASSIQTTSSQLPDWGIDPETARPIDSDFIPSNAFENDIVKNLHSSITCRGDIPSTSTGNSSTGSIGNEDHSSKSLGLDFSTSRKTTETPNLSPVHGGSRKVRIKINKFKEAMGDGSCSVSVKTFDSNQQIQLSFKSPLSELNQDGFSSRTEEENGVTFSVTDNSFNSQNASFKQFATAAGRDITGNGFCNYDDNGLSVSTAVSVNSMCDKRVGMGLSPESYGGFHEDSQVSQSARLVNGYKMSTSQISVQTSELLDYGRTCRPANVEPPFEDRLHQPNLSKAWVGPSANMHMGIAQMGISGTKIVPSLCHSKKKMELKMSKKVALNKLPNNVRKLLSTGLLEGHSVKYIFPEKKGELHGIINGQGYLCLCPSCDGSKVLTAYEFEQHAGCISKHPNTHIFLENGKTIFEIVQELKGTPLDCLDEVVQTLIGPPFNGNNSTSQSWKESSHRSSQKVQKVYRSCEEAQLSQLKLRIRTHPKISSLESTIKGSLSLASSSMIQNKAEEQELLAHKLLKSEFSSEPEDSAFKSTTRKRCKAQGGWRKRLPKSEFSSEPEDIAFKSTSQKRSKAEGCGRKRDGSLHQLLFKADGLPDGTQLAYYSKGQRLLEGYKQGNGIVCSCCDSAISPSQFEAHAGWATRRQPYRHIYTSNGLSLHELSISLSRGQQLAASDSDDLCTICGDGGELLLCDRCPRAFHTVCLELQSLPEGDWYCPYCKDKFGAGKKGDSGETSPTCLSRSVRPIELLNRCMRVVKASTNGISSCVVCRGHDFSVSKFGPRTVMLCDQCEKEFHVGCLKERGMCDLKELPRGKWFCSADCTRIHASLQTLIVNGAEIPPASLSSIIYRKHGEKGLTIEAGVDVRWQLLSGKIGSISNRSLLSKAAAIFRECFDPIVVMSGRDLIPSMVYGRNIGGQEFGGMYCAVLTVNSTVVSAGVLRIFGQVVAELPLVATSRECQGQGYFQVLFACIERLLGFLNVENLVLPAAEEAESIWMSKFGFRKMAEEQLHRYTRDYQMMMFNGTSMLEKAVPRLQE